MKSLNSLNNLTIQVELDLHSYTSVVDSNILVVHDHECYVDVCGYDSKSYHYC